MNANVISRIEYNAPLLAGEDNKVKQRIYRTIHRARRYIRGNFCYREIIASIMKSIGWKMPCEYLEESSARLTHKIIHKENPQSLANKIKKPRSRTLPDMTLKTKSKSRRMEKTILNTGIRNFNRLQTNLKTLEPMKLKRALKTHKLLPDKVMQDPASMPPNTITADLLNQT